MKNKLLYRKRLWRLASALCMMVLSTQLSWGQTTILHETFGTTAIGNPYSGTTSTIPTGLAYTTTNSLTPVAVTVSAGNGILAFTGTNGGKATVSAPFASLGTIPLNTTLANNGGIVTWTVNMKNNRNTAVMGTTTINGAHYAAVILCATNANFTTTTSSTGYALLLNKGTTTTAVKLVKFSGIDAGGLTTTTLITGPDTAGIPNWQSVRVTYNPSTGVWTLATRDDATTVVDPTSGSLTTVGTTSTDAAYTNTAMTHFGIVGSATSTQTVASFDNLRITVDPSINVPAPTSLTAFTYLLGNGPSTEQSFTVNALNLTNDLVITAPADYEISATSGSGFSSSITISAASAVAPNTIYVRLKAGLAAGTYNGQEVVLSSTGSLVNRKVICSGSVSASASPEVSVSTTSLAAFPTTNAGSNSSSSSFTVSGIFLGTNDITVTPPANFQISTDNVTFSTTAIALSPVAGTVATTTIYARYSPTGSGAYSDNIVVASTSVPSQNVSVSGYIGTFYSTGSGALESTTSWSATSDGLGSLPNDFTTAGITYTILTNRATTAAWIVSGLGSKVVVGDAAVPAVALTVASTFPITGTIDIAAASSGANSLIWQDNTSPTFGTIHSSSELYLRPTANATYFFTPTPTFGKLFIDGTNTVGIGNSFSIATLLNLASSSTLNLAFGGTTFATLGAGATATINGKIITQKGSNGEMFTFSNAGNGALRFFDPITTPSILTLGSDSTVELSNSATGNSGNQTVSVLPAGVSYANLILSSTASPNTKNITGAVTVTNKLTINLATGATLNLGAGLLTLKSTATKTAVVAPLTTAPTITGTLVAERYIPAGNSAYRLLSPATTGGTIQANWQEAQADGINANVGFGTHITGTGAAANGFDTTATNSASLFTHTNTGAPAAWTPATNTNVNTLTAGSPFLIFIRGSRDASNIDGTPLKDATTLRTTGALATGTQVVNGLNTTANGFSLIGNPYQAQVDMQAVLSASTDLVQGFYYVVDPSLGTKGAYYTVDVTAASTADYSKYLQPGQACFVKTVASPTAPALTFLEANKSETDAQTSIFRTKNNVMSNIELTLLNGSSKRLDVLKIAFDASETNDVNQNDATKLTNFDENMATSNAGKLLAIEKRAIAVETDEIPLNITRYRGTSYTIKAQGTGLTGETPYLVDAFTNNITEIPQDGSVEYAFTVDTTTPASIAADRFKIKYSNSTLKTIDNASEGFALYPNPSKSNSFNVVVPQGMKNASLTVSNMLGQKLYSQNDLQSGATARVNVSNVKTAGVYLVSLTSEGKTVTTKWIVE